MSEDKSMDTFDATGGEDLVEASMCECIKFHGEESKLPAGGQIRDPSLKLEDFFTNWDEAERGVDLIVDEALVKQVNETYGGRGILLQDATNPNKLLTLEEWSEVYNGTDGLLLWGVKMHYRKQVGSGVRVSKDDHVYAIKIGKG